MLYYSEVLKKPFNSEDECLKAEAEYETALAEEKEKKAKLTAEKKERAKEVETAFNDVVAAEKKYTELRNAFVNDYGYYHMSYKDKNSRPLTSIFDFFNYF